MNPIKWKIQKHIKSFEINVNHIEYCNRCDMLHLAAWYDESVLQLKDKYVVLKDRKNCYVIKEGIWNSDTCHLAEPFVALQMYYGLSILQAYVVCDEFMKTAKKNNLRYYCKQVYGEPDIPTVPTTSLNYVVDQNILYKEDVALQTLYGILSDCYKIDRKVISRFVDSNLITVDPNFNICFNSFDSEGNVISVLKLSRYKHSNTRFSFNHYITKRNAGFVYYSNDEHSPTEVTVFDSPIEMLSYLSLEMKTDSPVPKLSDRSCLLSMYCSNFTIVEDFLKSNTLEAIYNGIKLNNYNYKTIRKYIRVEAKRHHIYKVNELSQYILTFLENNKANFPDGYRIEGWHKLLESLDIDSLPNDHHNPRT